LDLLAEAETIPLEGTQSSGVNMGNPDSTERSDNAPQQWVDIPMRGYARVHPDGFVPENFDPAAQAL
jgi:hypothetical protein